MKKEKREILKEKYAGGFEGKDPKKKPGEQEQKNLFGDKDQIYNTIQSEISIIVAEIRACHDSIGKQEDKIKIRQRRKDNLERAARSIAKMRDEELKKKKEEKLKR